MDFLNLLQLLINLEWSVHPTDSCQQLARVHGYVALT